MRNLLILLGFTLPVMLSSCANQLPPPGGEDDRIPPRILSVYPSPGTKNFKGREVSIRFDEYVDKRSFLESFSIYPEPPGGTEINWSGKEVTIELLGKLSNDRTYVVNIGRDLKDIRGGNALSMPAVFAFSTGNRIDSGRISGRIVADKLDRVKILLYRIESQKDVDPTKQKAEYTVEPQDNGVFAFAFLPDGRYRVFGIYDDDRNSLYGKNIEKIAIPAEDIVITNGSSFGKMNLILTEIFNDPGSDTFLKSLKPDTSGMIYSNIPSKGIRADAGIKLYFYFRKNELSKQDIVSNFSLTDTTGVIVYKPVFNWINDSLLEVFSTEKFKTNSDVVVRLDLRQTKTKNYFEEQFSISEKEAKSVVSGRLTGKRQEFQNMRLILSEMSGAGGIFRASADEEGRFIFRNIPEGTYRLIMFDDDNDNGVPDKGTYEPFRFSEKIQVYEKEIKVKNGWNVEDILPDF